MSKLLRLSHRRLWRSPRQSLSLSACSKSAPNEGNDYSYDQVVKNFEWKVPDKWNFAQDVVDVWADSTPDNLAFYHVATDDKTNTQWSYKVCVERIKSNNSKIIIL